MVLVQSRPLSLTDYTNAYNLVNHFRGVIISPKQGVLFGPVKMVVCFNSKPNAIYFKLIYG